MPNSKQELLIPMNHCNLVFSCEKTLRVLCLPKGFSYRDSFGASGKGILTGKTLRVSQESNFGFLQVYNIYCCYNNPKKLKLITKIFIR